MQIKSLTIFGYGKMHNVTFDHIGMLQVFYGANEAGKSTIMSFIHSILFGFPTKQHNENRYEPKTHSSYGGKILLATKEYGDVTIQRMKGKAIGDVTITYQDGRMGTEEDLQLLLKGIDKATYQAVFSFNLEGLNHLHRLDENKVSRYLLSIGLLGSGGLLHVEQTLQKEMDQLFKPSGKNPTINVMLAKMKEHYDRLQLAEQEQSRYDELRSILTQLEEEKRCVEQRVSELESNLTSSNHYKNMEPLILEEQRLQAKIELLGNVSLPSEINDRYDSLQREIEPIRVQLSSLLQQQNIIEDKLSHLQYDKNIIEEKEQIQKALERTASLKSLQQQLQQGQLTVEQSNSIIQQLKDYVHISFDEEKILQLDTSAVTKQRITELHKKSEKLERDKHYLDERQASEEAALQTLEQRIDYLHHQVLEDEKREHLERQVYHQKNDEQNRVELRFLEQSIQALEKRILVTTRNEQKNKKSMNVTIYAVIGICSLGILGSLFINQYSISAVLVALIIVIMVLKGKLRSTSIISELEQELEELKNRRDLIKRERLIVAQDEVEILLKKDDEVRQQLSNTQLKKVDHEVSFHSIVDEYEVWEQETIMIKQEIAEILSQWNLPQQSISTEMLLTIYDSITELKQHIYEKKHIAEKVAGYLEEISFIEHDIWHYCALLGQVNTESVQEAVVMLRNKLIATERMVLEEEQLLGTRKVLHNQISDLTFQKQYIERQLVQLYSVVKCENEEAFLKTAALVKERLVLEEKLERIQLQLKPYETERVYWEQSDIMINDYTIQLLEEQIQNAKKQKEDLLKRIVATKHHIEQLENGGTYDDRYFIYSVKKSELDTEAKEWMKYALAKNMLQNVIKMYKNTKFPQILQVAEQHLSFITNGEYFHLYWNDESNGLLLQRKDSMVFEAKEVSRGTQEAVYVSLRLALAQQTYENDGLPIIIDDSFVNFDWARVQRIVLLLHQIKKTHQIIFFTCHTHLLALFKDDHIICLHEEVEL